MLFLALNTYLCVSIILVIMKKRVLLWMAGLVFAVTSLFAQDIPVGVVVAFKKGNSQELNKYLGEKVDLVIQNRSTSVDKQTAEGTLASPM